MHGGGSLLIPTEVCKSCIFEYPALRVSSIIKGSCVRSLSKELGQLSESFNAGYERSDTVN